MFIKTQGFKKIISEAYKGIGLTVGSDGTGHYLCGGWWGIWVKKEAFPKEELGELIKLTGELPEVGRPFRATKDGNQYEIPETQVYRFMENAEQCEEYMEITPITLKYKNGVQARILQSPYSNMIILINEKIIDMIDNTAVRYDDGETQAEGPLIGKEPGVFWMNNQMALHVMYRTDDKNKELIAYLENFAITKQGEENEH